MPPRSPPTHICIGAALTRPCGGIRKTMAQMSPAAANAHAGPSMWERLRRDKPWWLLPLTVVCVLGGFSVYGTWTAVWGGRVDCASDGFHCGPYLSPFYSPQVGHFFLPAPLNS